MTKSKKSNRQSAEQTIAAAGNKWLLTGAIRPGVTVLLPPVERLMSCAVSTAGVQRGPTC